MNDPREEVRNSIRELMELNVQRDEIVRNFADINASLDIARQQNFLAIVDLLKSESLDLLKDGEFFDYVLSGFLSWKHYEGTKNNELQRLLEHSMFGSASDDTVSGKTEEAESILEYSGLDLSDSMNVETALNAVFVKLGFQLSVVHSIMTTNTGERAMGLMLVAEIRDTELFMQEIGEYEHVFTSFAKIAEHGSKAMQEDGGGSFSFIVLITENRDQADPNTLPLVSSGTVSPFDQMDGDEDFVWNVYQNTQDMAKRNTYDFYPDVVQAVRGLQRLQR